MQFVDLITDDPEVGDLIASDLRRAGVEHVRIVKGVTTDCVSCRVTADSTTATSGLAAQVIEVVKCAFARRFYNVDAHIESRQITAQDRATLRVELPMELLRSRRLNQKMLATAPQYRLTVWGQEALALDALRPLKHMRFDYELGPSTWEGERKAILFGGAPDLLIGHISRLIEDTVGVTLHGHNCWDLENRRSGCCYQNRRFSPRETG